MFSGREHGAVEDDSVLGDDADNEAGLDAEELQRQAADGDELAQWALDIAGGMEGEPGYPTPEDAALAEWVDYPGVVASIVSVEYVDANNAVVITDTVPSHPMWNYCVRTPSGWVFTHDHN